MLVRLSVQTRLLVKIVLKSYNKISEDRNILLSIVQIVDQIYDNQIVALWPGTNDDERVPHVWSCLAEYEDIEGRRYRAEPNACSHCGPRYTLYKPNRTAVDTVNVWNTTRELINEVV